MDLGKVAPYELVVDESFSLPFFVQLTSNHIAAFCSISSGLACILSEYLSNQVGMSCCVCAASVIFGGQDFVYAANVVFVRFSCMQPMSCWQLVVYAANVVFVRFL